MAGIIKEVIEGSIGEELELSSDDKLLSINGQEIMDIIDYRYYSAEEELDLEIEKADGQIWECSLEKDADEDLGLVFDAEIFDGIKICQNHCLFCFMDQLPPQHRSSLHLKDDDYRLSFLEGNFITGTNLKEKDIQRIIDLRLSPLYISIHVTDDQLRSSLIGNKRGAILPLLRVLIDNGIEIHGQIVLCPGINDGRILANTLADLEALRPGMLSVAMVPVGLTKYQLNQDLRVYTQEEAAAIVDFVTQKQKQSLAASGSNFYFLGDEFYLLAKRPIADYETYEGFPQLENGVGMARLFLHQWQGLKADLPEKVDSKEKILLITGFSAQPILQSIMEDLTAVQGLDIELLPVENRFFGPSVTVAGLLTGSCLLEALSQQAKDMRILYPANMLKFSEDIFLDSLCPRDVEEKLSIRLESVEPDALSLYEAIFGDN